MGPSSILFGQKWLGGSTQVYTAQVIISVSLGIIFGRRDVSIKTAVRGCDVTAELTSCCHW